MGPMCQSPNLVVSIAIKSTFEVINNVNFTGPIIYYVYMSENNPYSLNEEKILYLYICSWKTCVIKPGGYKSFPSSYSLPAVYVL